MRYLLTFISLDRPLSRLIPGKEETLSPNNDLGFTSIKGAAVIAKKNGHTGKETAQRNQEKQRWLLRADEEDETPLSMGKFKKRTPNLNGAVDLNRVLGERESNLHGNSLHKQAFSSMERDGTNNTPSVVNGDSIEDGQKDRDILLPARREFRKDFDERKAFDVGTLEKLPESERGQDESAIVDLASFQTTRHGVVSTSRVLEQLVMRPEDDAFMDSTRDVAQKYAQLMKCQEEYPSYSKKKKREFMHAYRDILAVRESLRETYDARFNSFSTTDKKKFVKIFSGLYSRSHQAKVDNLVERLRSLRDSLKENYDAETAQAEAKTRQELSTLQTCIWRKFTARFPHHTVFGCVALYYYLDHNLDQGHVLSPYLNEDGSSKFKAVCHCNGREEGDMIICAQCKV